jgi:hypothetical protein
MRIIILVGIVFLLLACTGNTDKKAFDGSSFKGSNYTITVPTGWQAQKNMAGCDVFITNPVYAIDDGFAESLNVVLENVPFSVTETQYVTATVESLATIFDASITERNPCILNGHNANRIRYSATIGNLNMDNDVYLIVDGRAAYVVTLSTLAGKSRTQHIAELTLIAESFVIQ